MRYVIDKTKGAWSVTVSDETGELVKVDADDKRAANALVKAAAKDGWQSIAPKPAAKKVPAKGA